MVKLTEHDGLLRETMRRRLADDGLKPWRRDMWCVPRIDGVYVARMEDVLDLYAEAPDPRNPVICFDERPTQLIGEVREPIPAAPGQPERYEYEYRRNGTVNLFVFLDAHKSWRHVKVTEQRTARDLAVRMRDLADVPYPDADRIRVVMDNLSTHNPGALYETVPAPEAHRILQRLEFHYTPQHASWLNPRIRKGKQWWKSRSVCRAASAWIAVSRNARFSKPKSARGNASATPRVPGSNGGSPPRRHGKS